MFKKSQDPKHGRAARANYKTTHLEFNAHPFVGVFAEIPEGSRAGGPDAVGATVLVEVVVAVLAAGGGAGVEVKWKVPVA